MSSIALTEMDPRIAAAIDQKLRPLGSPSAERDPAAQQVMALLPRWRSVALRFGAWTLAGLPAAIAAGVMITAMEPDEPWGLLTGLGVAIATTVAGFVSSRRALAQMRSALLPGELRALMPGLSLTEVERNYCEVLCLLAETAAYRDAAARRDLLVELNALLASYRSLGTQRQALQDVIAAGSVAAIAAERDALAQQLVETEDAVARQAVEQSLALCDDRLAHARAIEPGLERIEAQQGVILQALASVRASLARTRAAPTPAAAPLAAELQRSIAGVSAQTKAVEEAVKEVLTLRAG